MEIGKQIRTLRMINALTLEELASRCELTKGYLSQLERDLTSPSINTLRDICEVLGVSMSDFFKENTEEKQVYSPDDFFVDQKPEHTIKWIVPNAQIHTMEPILVSLPPGGKSPVLSPHEGEEFGFVLSGKLLMVYGNKQKEIPVGYSFYLLGKNEHYFINKSATTAEYLWVSNPPLF